jgi:UDPglucose 6-dehydrogenase
VAFLGLSYKPCTSVVEQSQALQIAGEVARSRRFKVRAYDPMAMRNAAACLGKRVQFVDSVKACLREADVCVLGTPWEEFRTLTGRQVKAWMRHPRMIDCWRCLPVAERKAMDYIAVGLGRV